MESRTNLYLFMKEEGELVGGDTGKSHKFDGWIAVRDGLEDGQRIKRWIGVPHL